MIIFSAEFSCNSVSLMVRNWKMESDYAIIQFLAEKTAFKIANLFRYRCDL